MYCINLGTIWIGPLSHVFVGLQMEMKLGIIIGMLKEAREWISGSLEAYWKNCKKSVFGENSHLHGHKPRPCKLTSFTRSVYTVRCRSSFSRKCSFTRSDHLHDQNLILHGRDRAIKRAVLEQFLIYTVGRFTRSHLHDRVNWKSSFSCPFLSVFCFILRQLRPEK